MPIAANASVTPSIARCMARWTAPPSSRATSIGRDQHVVLDPDELDALRPAQDRALRLERFVDPGQCDPVLFSGRSLHLLPDGVAADHAYEVLRESLVRKARWAIGRLVLSGHRQVALLRPVGTLLLLHVLHYPETVRAAARPSNGRSGVSAAELQLAAQLIDAASGPVDWSAYPDQTAEELRSLVEAKIQGQAPRPAEPAAVVLPLLKALQQSIANLESAEETCPAFQGALAAQTRQANGMMLPDLLPMLAVPASPFDSPGVRLRGEVRRRAGLGGGGGGRRAAVGPRTFRLHRPLSRIGGVAPLAAGHVGGRRTGGHCGTACPIWLPC